MMINYEDFDNNINPHPSKYGELHKEILQVLQERPMNIYELRNVIESKGDISGQLTFLKSKDRVINKRFSGVVYWALAEENRNTQSKPQQDTSPQIK